MPSRATRRSGRRACVSSAVRPRRRHLRSSSVYAHLRWSRHWRLTSRHPTRCPQWTPHLIGRRRGPHRSTWSRRSSTSSRSTRARRRWYHKGDRPHRLRRRHHSGMTRRRTVRSRAKSLTNSKRGSQWSELVGASLPSTRQCPYETRSRSEPYNPNRRRRTCISTRYSPALLSRWTLSGHSSRNARRRSHDRWTTLWRWRWNRVHQRSYHMSPSPPTPSKKRHASTRLAWRLHGPRWHMSVDLPQSGSAHCGVSACRSGTSTHRYRLVTRHGKGRRCRHRHARLGCSQRRPWPGLCSLVGDRHCRCYDFHRSRP